MALMAIVMSPSLFAQDGIRIGATGGILNTSTSINGSNFGFNINAINKIGYYFGAVGEVSISEKINVQAELLYGSAGEIGFISLPLLVKYYIVDGLNVQIGPQFNIATNRGEIRNILGLVADEIETDDLNSIISRTGVDFGFGAGYDLTDHLSAQARFAIELTNRYNGTEDNDFKVRASTFNVGVVYFF